MAGKKGFGKTTAQIKAEAQAKIDARKKKNVESAAVSREAAAPQVQQDIRDRAEQAQQRRQSILTEYGDQLDNQQLSGQNPEYTPSEEWTPERHPNAISHNATYHDELFNHINEVESRLDAVRNDAADKELKKQNELDEINKSALAEAAKNGTGYEKKTSTTAATRGLGAKTFGQMQEVQRHLDLAKSKLNNSVNAHLAGSALTAIPSFAEAADHLHDALNAMGQVSSRDVKPVLGQSAGFAELGMMRPERTGVLVNRYTIHALPSVRPEHKAAVLEAASRTYSEDEPSRSFVALPGPKPKTAARATPAPHYAAGIVGRGGNPGPTPPVVEANFRLKELAGRTEHLSEDEQNAKIAEVMENLPDQPKEDYSVRWRREAIQKDWEAENPGKTFVGSDAHADPEHWNLKRQVRSAWMRASKLKNTPETRAAFEGTQFAAAPKAAAEKWGLQTTDLLDTHYRPFALHAARLSGLSGGIKMREEDYPTDFESQEAREKNLEFDPKEFDEDGTPLTEEAKKNESISSRIKRRTREIKKEEADRLAPGRKFAADQNREAAKMTGTLPGQESAGPKPKAEEVGITEESVQKAEKAFEERGERVQVGEAPKIDAYGAADDSITDAVEDVRKAESRNAAFRSTANQNIIRSEFESREEEK